MVILTSLKEDTCIKVRLKVSRAFVSTHRGESKFPTFEKDASRHDRLFVFSKNE